MEVSSPINEVDFTFYKLKSTHPPFNKNGLTDETKELELPYGKAFLRQWIFDGIRILHSKHAYNNHYRFLNNNEGNVVNLEFNISGRYEIHHYGNVYHVLDQQHNVIYTPGTHNTFRNIDLVGESFKIEFQPGYFLDIIKDSNEILQKFAGQMLQNKPVVLSPSSGVIDAQIARAIRDITNCNFSGGIKKIFLLSKCLEILVLQAESFAYTENPKHVYVKRKDDLERLGYVRKYLVEHADMPPSLSELAKKSGMNEYKLKRGFKEAYQNTVFGYLSEYRLNKAMKVLESGNRSVSEVAYELGYSSPQHFSKAFKLKFGLSPKSVRKNN